MMRAWKSIAVAAVGLTLFATAAACSNTGGKQADQSDNIGVNASNSGPRLKIAMITHGQPGDTFWDLVQKGGKAASTKDNVQFLYTAAPQGPDQARLVESAINEKVDGIIVTLAKPDDMKAAVQKAVAAGIPVIAINAGEAYWRADGALSFFGQDESVAGQAAGDQLNTMGVHHVVCVNQDQTQVVLQDRCAGIKKTFHGTEEQLTANGTDMTSFQSTITAKLQEDSSIDAVVTLGAPFALTAEQAIKGAGSKAKLGTFDLNASLVKELQSGGIDFAVDQQPWLQGYEAVDALWLYKNNADVVGGGQPVLTGPAIVTKDNVAQVAQYAARGTR
jgi:simple sugar transport system substrate-binding protein